MLATLAPMQQTPNPEPSHYPWTPRRPSPLSPQRSHLSRNNMIITPPNQQTQLQPQSQAPPSPFNFYPSLASSPSRGPSDTPTTPLPKATATTTTTSSPDYATRYTTTISKPLLSHSAKRTFTASNTPAARSARRNAFLNRVKQERDNGKFESRVEQLAFMESIAEQREWNESMRRKAEEIEAELPWEAGLEDEQGVYSGMPYLFSRLVGEEVWHANSGLSLAEDAEVQALDEYLEQEHALEMDLLERIQPAQNIILGTAASSFSDEEYEDIFMDLVGPSPPQDMDVSS